MTNHSMPDMTTAQGHGVWYLHPDRTVVDVKDLETHTSNMCRYSGAIDVKLVRHLALVIKLIELHRKLTPLPLPIMNKESIYNLTIQMGFGGSHDLHEIYVTDVVSGLKKFIPAYCDIENAFESMVGEAIGLPLEYRNNTTVRYADIRALIVEMTALNHPAASMMADTQSGVATTEELTIFETLTNMPVEHCWLYVWETIQKAAAELRIQEK